MKSDQQQRQFDKALTAIALLRAVVFLCVVGAIPCLGAIDESPELGWPLLVSILLAAVLFKAVAAALAMLRLIAMSSAEQTVILKSLSPAVLATPEPEPKTHEPVAVSMAGTVTCPSCSSRLRLDPQRPRPATVRCSACDATIRLREAPPAS